MTVEVVIVGGGLAGLACARRLAQLGVSFTLLEAAERVGGRVVTDTLEGFRLDRGFQVLLDSYPEARATLDLGALGAGAFGPGALVRAGGRFQRVVDPWRAPLQGLATLGAPFVTLLDAFRMARLRHDALASSGADVTGTADDYLQARGFSPGLRASFLRPFFAGVTLDPELRVPASYLLSLFGWFARGSAVLPEEGMQAIPEQLASGLPAGAVRLGQRVAGVSGGRVELTTGEALACRAVVLAADASTTAKLLRSGTAPEWLGTTTLYYAAERSPIDEPLLVLNGKGAADGPVNNLSVLSDAQPSYAPPGSSLVSISVLGVPRADDDRLDAEVRAQVGRWFGDEVRGWRRLRVDRIPRALPRRTGPLEPAASIPGVHVCGDHVATPSIQGSLESGRLTAQAVHAALGGA